MAGPSGMFGGVRPGAPSSSGKSMKEHSAKGSGASPLVPKKLQSKGQKSGQTKAGSAPAPMGHTLAKK